MSGDVDFIQPSVDEIIVHKHWKASWLSSYAVGALYLLPLFFILLWRPLDQCFGISDMTRQESVLGMSCLLWILIIFERPWRRRQTLRFDRVSRTLARNGASIAVFDDLDSVLVRIRKDEGTADGRISLTFKDGTALILVDSLSNEDETAVLAARFADFLGVPIRKDASRWSKVLNRLKGFGDDKGTPPPPLG